jgi:hypothetical protein
VLPPTQTLWECLFRCYEDETFLIPLTSSFFKLTLQLLIRYSNWVQVGIERLNQSNTTAASGGNSAANTTGTATSTSTSDDISWVDWLSPEQHMLLVFDLQRLLTQVLCDDLRIMTVLETS